MKVLIDTSVWSHVLRRSTVKPGRTTNQLNQLILDGRATIIGAIRQELLSGVKTEKQYSQLRDKLRAFPDEALTHKDYELAAHYFNLCRAKGIQGSNTDFLICAVVELRGYQLFTTDTDFEYFSQVIPVRSYAIT